MGWILFLNEDEKPCAWPAESTMIGINEGDEVVMTLSTPQAPSFRAGLGVKPLRGFSPKALADPPHIFL